MEPAGEGVEVRKRTYEKPTFAFERVFETMALSCGKLGVFGGQCNGGGPPGAGASS